jgi:hypothetical protein
VAGCTAVTMAGHTLVEVVGCAAVVAEDSSEGEALVY